VTMPSILMVLTRDLGEVASSGREKTLHKIRDSFRHLGKVVELRVKNVLEDPSPARWARMLGWGISELTRGRPEPLQSLLFHDGRALKALVDCIRREQPEAVYFDSIRCAYFAVSIRKLFPALRLVADFDDLMSERYRELRQAGFDLSVGYLERYTPAWLRGALNGALRGLVLRYEAFALSGWERRVLDAVDAVTLVSAVETESLRVQLVALKRRKVHWIPPSQSVTAGVMKSGTPRRFIFIGSDSLLQNRLTIDWLVDKWSQLQPLHPLHVFGKMRRGYPLVDGVHFEGFADSLEKVYTSDSILLAPSFLAGGVKTKIIEALAAGVLTVGNRESFGGLGLQDCGLALSEPEMEQFILHPEQHMQRLTARAHEVRQWLRDTLQEPAIRARWATALNVRLLPDLQNVCGT
jgi:glycosyltransferase involved in cell wall biosynthesis